MKWVLLIHLVAPGDYVEYEPLPFETRDAYVAAAAAYVEKYPAFEWRDRSGKGLRVELPVVRSYVECISVEEYKRRKYRDDDGKVE